MNDIVTDPALTGQGGGTEQPAPQPQVTSLDSLSEFEFQGEKLTPDRLQEVFKGYRDYTEKQKASAAEARFEANLGADLKNVLQDPTLAQRFKSIYPQKFHAVLDSLLEQSQPANQNNPQGALPKEFLSEFSQMKQHLHQMAVESANAKLDATLPKLYEKYPLANEDQVLAKAEIFLSNGGKLTDQVWERLAKESHEMISKKADAFYKKQLQSQLDKGQLAKDAGPGGAVPGKAPPKLRTFDDAGKAMIEHLKANGFT